MMLHRFHTTMVLTQHEYIRLLSDYSASFHTTMVLTQRELLFVLESKDSVSIPLWFSRNGCREDNLPYSNICFHTTMVLTQPGRGPPR